jgi:3-isopropylmalate/(R)-2-methylmalate dehydratase small subunit
MQPFTTHAGIVAPLEAMHVDTDQIMPKQWLKRIERTGYEKYLFSDWRFKPDGSVNESFEMNAPRYQGASILLALDNFGCGSSREHAVWGLENFGFRCVIAPSFADIFYNNCFNNGVLPIAIPGEAVAQLFKEVRATEGYKLTIELPNQDIVKPDGSKIHFELDPFRKRCLLEGLDTIGLTLLNEKKIAAYEHEHAIA